MNQDLIYGKNPLTNIVSIEPQETHVEIFREFDYGVVSEFYPIKYWLLSSKPYDFKYISLKGDQHYKYGRKFDCYEDFQNYKKFGKDVYCIWNKKESVMVNYGYTYFKGMKKEDVSRFSFDLETTSLDPKDPNALILLISTRYTKNGKIKCKLFAYDEYASEKEMIEAFCSYVLEVNPSLLIGHNLFGFDFKYLNGRCEQNGAKLILGRDKSEAVFDKKESKFRKEGTQFIHYTKCNIYGREIIDTMFTSIKHDVATRKYENFRLKNIIKQEGKEKANRTFYDANLIRVNYKNPTEWEKIKKYCEDDADDADMLFDLQINPFFYMAQSIPKSFQEIICGASGSQLNSMMVRSYLQMGYSIPKGDNKEVFDGGISMGNPGVYTNCVKIDIASLYPSIMLQYDIYDKQKDPNKHILQILETFTKERLKNKKLFKDTGDDLYDGLQGAQKIVINSIYGFLGAPNLNYNSPNCAALVTAKGREILQYTIEWATGQKYEVN